MEVHVWSPHKLLTSRCSDSWTKWVHPATQESYSLTLHKSTALSTADLEACFRLIESTSSDDYKKSKQGWMPRSKRKEMKLFDLKYLLVKKDNQVEGFLSFMPTYEDDFPVIYCYEIHLSPPLQGCARVLHAEAAEKTDENQHRPRHTAHEPRRHNRLTDPFRRQNNVNLLHPQQQSRRLLHPTRLHERCLLSRAQTPPQRHDNRIRIHHPQQTPLITT